jgi:hypothetical protein
MTTIDTLTPEQVESFDRDGFLIVEAACTRRASSPTR